MNMRQGEQVSQHEFGADADYGDEEDQGGAVAVELDEAEGEGQVEQRMVYQVGGVVDLSAHAGEAAGDAGDFAVAAVEDIPEVDEDQSYDFGPQGREGEEGRSDDAGDHHEDGHHVRDDAEAYEEGCKERR